MVIAQCQIKRFMGYNQSDDKINKNIPDGVEADCLVLYKQGKYYANSNWIIRKRDFEKFVLRENEKTHRFDKVLESSGVVITGNGTHVNYNSIINRAISSFKSGNDNCYRASFSQKQKIIIFPLAHLPEITKMHRCMEKYISMGDYESIADFFRNVLFLPKAYQGFMEWFDIKYMYRTVLPDGIDFEGEKEGMFCPHTGFFCLIESPSIYYLNFMTGLEKGETSALHHAWFIVEQLAHDFRISLE